MRKVATFYSFKGGVGRTMGLANVAVWAAREGKTVAVLDFDLDSPGVAMWLPPRDESGAPRRGLLIPPLYKFSLARPKGRR